MKEPKVHVMSEPEFGILVTGTHDVEAARKLALNDVREHVETFTTGDEDDEIAVAEWFERHPAKLQTGRTIRALNNDWLAEDLGVRWWWRTGYELGKPGVTRAVVFQ